MNRNCYIEDMGKHAYLISAHTSFDQLCTLLRMLDDERNDIFLHIDKKVKDVPFDRFRSSCTKAGLFFTERINVHWGGPSQIWSELLLLKEAASKGAYSYHHLLSGLDLPIKSQDYIHDFFDRNAGKEFISFWMLKKHTPSRFIRVPLSEYGGSHFWANLLNCIFKGIGKIFKTYRFSGVDYRYGPNWFSITDDLARYVISREEWIRQTFRGKCNCDEIFLQTLVASSEFYGRCYDNTETQSDEISSANMRLVDWTRSDGSSRHPWTFKKEDFRMLMDAPQLWARKFDAAKDGEIIKMIEQHFAPRP